MVHAQSPVSVTPASLIEQTKNLPPAPTVLLSLRKLLADPNSTVESIAKVISMDSIITGQVVRMANSAHFGGSTRVSSIDEAAQRTGQKGILEIVTYAAASQLVGKPLHAYNLDSHGQWQRSIACAIAAASLADRTDVNRDDAYTAGLMHAVGLIVLDLYASHPERRWKFASAGYPLDSTGAEKEKLGFAYPEVGAALLAHWGFAQPVTAAVAHQMDPMSAPAEHRKLSAVLAIARWARSVFCASEDILPLPPETEWLAEIGVERFELGEWLRLTRVRFSIAASELKLGGRK
jgi:HD-like signal output (HDOD) protein